MHTSLCYGCVTRLGKHYSPCLLTYHSITVMRTSLVPRRSHLSSTYTTRSPMSIICSVRPCTRFVPLAFARASLLVCAPQRPLSTQPEGPREKDAPSPKPIKPDLPKLGRTIEDEYAAIREKYRTRHLLRSWFWAASDSRTRNAQECCSIGSRTPRL